MSNGPRKSSDCSDGSPASGYLTIVPGATISAGPPGSQDNPGTARGKRRRATPRRRASCLHCSSQIDSDSTGPSLVSRRKRISEEEALWRSQNFSSQNVNLNGQSFFFISKGSGNRPQLFLRSKLKSFHFS